MYYLIIPFSLVLAVYCYFEAINSFKVATSWKVILSAFIAGIAVCAAVILKEYYYYLIALGLLFAVPADFFLQYIKKSLIMYRFGIFFFGAMHICLLAGFYWKWGAAWHEAAILVGFLIILTCFQKLQKWDLSEAKFQLSAYTVLVTLMAAKTISVYINLPSAATLVLACGGLSFFVSDLFLGIWNYYKNKFVFLALNRIVYFAGQFLIAFSLFLFI